MTGESLREVIDAVRTRVQAELEAQLTVVTQRHEAALASARQDAERQAEAHWTAVLDGRTTDEQQERQAVIAAARAEADRRASDEIARVRADAERWVSEEAERIRTTSRAIDAGSLSSAFRDVDSAARVSDVLVAIAQAAAAIAPGAALFVGPQLDRWSTGDSAGTDTPVAGAAGEAVKAALTTATVVRDADRSIAAPLVLDGTAVGVLYAAPDSHAGAQAAWAGTLDALARYGSARLGSITALRTAHARQWISRTQPAGTAAPPAAPAELQNTDRAQSARRYARLVVSEIKLYNEAAVREGRAQRDLTRRLGPEIDRARRLYDERVPATVPDRSRYFQQELVQTLAGGDPSLLG